MYIIMVITLYTVRLYIIYGYYTVYCILEKYYLCSIGNAGGGHNHCDRETERQRDDNDRVGDTETGHERAHTHTLSHFHSHTRACARRERRERESARQQGGVKVVGKTMATRETGERERVRGGVDDGGRLHTREGWRGLRQLSTFGARA